MNEDEQYLKVLEIFHYVVGGLMAFLSCIPLIHVVIGIALLVAGGASGKPGEAVIGLFFIAVAGMVIACGWTLAACLIVAGRKLNKRRSRTFCLVVAGVSCLFMPWGTILGIFTIVVLMRDSVRRLFDGEIPPPPVP